MKAEDPGRAYLEQDSQGQDHASAFLRGFGLFSMHVVVEACLDELHESLRYFVFGHGDRMPYAFVFGVLAWAESPDGKGGRDGEGADAG